MDYTTNWDAFASPPKRFDRAVTRERLQRKLFGRPTAVSHFIELTPAALQRIRQRLQDGHAGLEEQIHRIKEASISQQQTEANVINRRLDDLSSERDRLTTEGYKTSERTEMFANRLEDLQLQRKLAENMGDKAKADALSDEIEQLEIEKFETADHNAKAALYSLMAMLANFDRMQQFRCTTMP